MSKPQRISEFFTFAIVGSGATACHFAIYYSLFHIESHTGANLVAYICATFVGYCGNNKFTFPNDRLLFRRYVAVSLVSLAISSIIALTLGDFLQLGGAVVFLAICCAGLPTSYFLQRRLSVQHL